MGATMAFTPENELEKALLLAASQQVAPAVFYNQLLNSELLVLGELGEEMSLETVENSGQKYHPVFSSTKRLNDFLQTPMPSFRMPCRALFQFTRGASFVINPRSELTKTLSPDEITWCLEKFPPRSGDIIVAQPKVFPTKLVKALCVLFTSRSLIRAAHLVYVAREGIDTEAHPMIGLEASADVPRLAQEIIALYDAVFPGMPIEVVYLPDGPLDPLQKHLLSVPPFYRRALLTN